ncbi:hypothetical protein pb186bvf_015868 [Paramecium bursaria]
MSKWTLRFQNILLEEQYDINQKPKYVSMFRITTLFQLLVNIIYFFNTYFVHKVQELSYYRIAFAMWHMILLGLQLTNFKVFRQRNVIAFTVYFNSILNLGLMYMYVSTVLYNKSCTQTVLTQALNSGINIEHFNISYILACPNWILQCLIAITTQVTIVGVFGNLVSSSYWTFYVLLLSLCLLFRVYESNFRLDFIQLYKQNANINACKKIFDKTIPNSIIVLAKDQSYMTQCSNRWETSEDQLCTTERKLQVLYNNDASLKYMGAKNQEEVLANMKQIFIQKDNSSVHSQLMSIYDVIWDTFNNHQSIQRPSLDDYALPTAESQQFICLMQKSREVMGSNKQIAFANETHFDIRILQCLWEKKPSVVVVINDISEKIRLKNMKQLDSYKDRLLATVSHDLKTPLNGMSILTQVMQELVNNKEEITTQDKQDLKKYLRDFHQSQLLLLSMINDLLDFSQINRGLLRLAPAQFTIQHTFDFIHSLLERQAKAKNIDLLWVIDIPIHYQTLFSDENRLKQIIINLVSNAIKFTSKGYIKITAKYINEPRDIIRISVKDTGQGIPISIQGHLFKLYSTFNFQNNNQHGVGLGLTITKQLVNLLGPDETLEFQSEVDKGTEFSFTIYRNLDDNHETFSPKQRLPSFSAKRMLKSVPSVIPSKHIKILLVDDTPINIIALGALITKCMKCEILKACNGVEALELVKREDVQIVFMDVNMPIMDGYECTKEIRKWQQQMNIHQFPIIMVTAFTNESDKQQSKLVGADSHLDKPVQILALKSILNDFGLL